MSTPCDSEMEKPPEVGLSKLQQHALQVQQVLFVSRIVTYFASHNSVSAVRFYRMQWRLHALRH